MENNLEEYQKKRNFKQTPEPPVESGKKGDEPIFTIQKHDASQLHYDLRLEAGGVLKSWAIPKGPTLNYEEKNLAIMTEDHPFDYANFEGVIPPGNYGAGNVMVWDTGTYFHPEFTKKKEIENSVLEGINKGHVTFILNGQKLKGEFALIKLKKSREKNAWLLIKAKDQYASEEDIRKNDRSALTNRTMLEIEASADLSEIEQINQIADQPLRNNFKPMLASLINKPFDRENWIFEVKWDGWRAITKINQSNILIYSRNGKILNDKFPEIIAELKKLKQEGLVVDGEIVALKKNGDPDFQLLQNYPKEGGILVYYLFDLLYFESKNIEKETLKFRKELLKKIIAPFGKESLIKFSDHVERDGISFFELLKQKNMEGMVCKDLNSFYKEGKRTADWLKIKTRLEQEAIIIGYTEPETGRTELGSLLLGVNNEKGNLQYVGNVGSGFSETTIKKLKQQLEALKTNNVETMNSIDLKNFTAVRPELVCEIKFQEWTKDNKIRQAVFLGLRDDIDPKEVKREVAEGE